MKHVLILGHSGGIGRALAQAYDTAGFAVTGLSRQNDGFDITDPAAVAHHMGQLTGPFDRIVIATGALEIDGYAPEKSVSSVTAQGMADQFAVNAIGPALVMKHIRPLIPRDRRCVIAALSARVGSIGDNRLGGWVSYRAAKAALNQIIHTSAIELGRMRPMSCCIALHPGTVATDFTAKYAGRHPTVPANEAAANLMRVIESRGPEHNGQFFDWRGDTVQW